MSDLQGQQNNFERTKELTDKLEAGLKDLFKSAKYKEYLQSVSHFHHYSSRNIMLIHMQMPGATQVASFKTWKEKFNRHVKKGEHGIRIFAPIAEKKPETKLMEKLDPATGSPILDAAGRPVMEEMTAMSTGPRFKLAPVFDVSQTDGEPLPELVENLTGNVAHYEAFMDALRAVSPLPITFEPMAGVQDGYCRYGVHIGIREGMSEIQTVSAVVHEITHAKLHDKTLPDADQTPKTKVVIEIEAESISYVVNQHFGIETSPNSFGYLAEYGSREMPELKASLDTIRKEANGLINAIDDRFQAIRKERGIDLTAKETEKPAPQVEQLAASQSNAGHYEIFQLRDDNDLRNHRFASLAQLKAESLAIDRGNYDLVYTSPLNPTETLGDLYERFNADYPKGYMGRSLSVSDVVVIHRDGEATAHYVDTFGFSQVPTFLADKQQEVTAPTEVNGPPNTQSAAKPEETQYGENVKAVEARVNAGEPINLTDLMGAIRADQQQPGSEPPPPTPPPAPKQDKPEPEPVKHADVAVYKQPLTYAREHDEHDQYCQSRDMNVACAAAINKAVEDSHYDTFHYDLKTAAQTVIAKYGTERVDWVLANTIQRQHYDGRYSDSNKRWARGFDIPSEAPSFFVMTHPHVLDGLIDRAREIAVESRPSVLAALKVNTVKDRHPSSTKKAPQKTKHEEL